jgi:Phosphohistidine phosphatase SixA
MNLYLMRHGIALTRDDPSVAHDAERPLTGKGVKRMRKAAKGLRELAIRFDSILTSPFRARARPRTSSPALSAWKPSSKKSPGWRPRARWNI